MHEDRTVNILQGRSADRQTIRQTLATESSTPRTDAHHRLIPAGDLSIRLTGQSGRAQTLNPSPSHENHPTTIPAVAPAGETLIERPRAARMMSIPFPPVKPSMRPPTLVDFSQQRRSGSDIISVPSPTSSGLSSLPMRRPMHAGSPQRAEAELDATPSPASGPSSATPSVPQTLHTPLRRHLSTFPADIRHPIRPRHPAQARGWSSTSPPESGVRTIKIGIESEFYLEARGVANTGDTLEEFIDILAANHNRELPAHPQMRRTLRPYEYDGNYYGKWCLVKESTIGTVHEPCKLLPLPAIA